MPRIRKQNRFLFPEVVRELFAKHSDFTLDRTSLAKYSLGAAVRHSYMLGIGYVVGYWVDSSIGNTVAYFPLEKRFIGYAGIVGCYSTGNFLEA